MPRAVIAIAIALAAPALTACGGARQEQVQLELDETKRKLDGLRDAYDAQRVQLESLRGRLDVVEDQLEARALHSQMSPATASAGTPRPLPVVRLAPTEAPPTAETGDAPAPTRARPPITPGELPPATITQADMDRLDGGGGTMGTSDPAPRVRRRRRPVPPPANAANAGNIGTRPLAHQPDFDARDEGPIATYRAAEARFRAGDHAGAIQGFETLIQTWPAHGFADNALYYIGRCRYARAEYRGALETFRAVLTRYPTGNQVPDALLMTGLTLEKLGRDAEGRETLGRLRAMYPDSAAGKQAAARLDRPDPRM